MNRAAVPAAGLAMNPYLRPSAEIVVSDDRVVLIDVPTFRAHALPGIAIQTRPCWNVLTWVRVNITDQLWSGVQR